MLNAIDLIKVLYINKLLFLATSKYFEKLEFNFLNRCNYSDIISYNYYNSNNINKCILTENEEKPTETTNDEEIKKEKLIGAKEIVIFTEILVIFNIILYNISYEYRNEETKVIIIPLTPRNKLSHIDIHSNVEIRLNSYL